MDILFLVLTSTLVASTPLVFTALGGMVSERSGVVNIGLEGMMTFGAFFGAITINILELNVTQNNFVLLLIGVLAAAIGGVIFALLHAVLCITFKLDQTISGVAINIAALGLALFLTNAIYGTTETTKLLVSKITFVDNKIYLITIISFVLVAIMYFVFKKTIWGIHVDAVGENPQAADAMGINVIAKRYQAVLVSGIFAGIGGMSLVLTINNNFSVFTVSGLGFISLAVMLFGQRKPFLILAAAILFGFFKNAATISSTIFTELPFDKVYLQILPYVLTIVFLVIFSKRSTDPSSLGKPYDKEMR